MIGKNNKIQKRLKNSNLLALKWLKIERESTRNLGEILNFISTLTVKQIYLQICKNTYMKVF